MGVFVDVSFLGLSQLSLYSILIEQEAVVSGTRVGDWSSLAKGGRHLDNVVIALARNDAA